MKIAKIINQDESVGTVDPSDLDTAQKVYQQCFQLQPKEKVLIVTDKHKKSEASIFFKAAQLAEHQTAMVLIKDMTENAQEPPTTVTKMMEAADVCLLITNFSLSHTRARAQATESGSRIASMPGLTTSMFPALGTDYQQLAKKSHQLANLLTASHNIAITSPAGTKLTASIKDRTGHYDDGNLIEAGSFSNLPAGEAYIAPIELETNGIIVFDGSLAGIDLDRPVTVTVKDGTAVEVSGGKAAAKLLTAMEQVGTQAKIAAEIGIGVNPLARVRADILESEKAFGTVHVAFGDNIGMGGDNEANFHTDGLILKPTVELDKQTVLRLGKFQL